MCRNFKKGQKAAQRTTKANSKSILIYEIANFHVKTVFEVRIRCFKVCLRHQIAQENYQNLKKATYKARKDQIKINCHRLSMILLIS